MLRLLWWRIVSLLAVGAGLTAAAWLLGGGPGRALRGAPLRAEFPGTLGEAVSRTGTGLLDAVVRLPGALVLSPPGLVPLGLGTLLLAVRSHARSRRRYVRLGIELYRTDHAGPEAVVGMFEALHRRLERRWWRRVLAGQTSCALEVHHGARDDRDLAWLAVTCPEGLEAMVETALRAAYPNTRLRSLEQLPQVPPAIVRLKKRSGFIGRSRSIERLQHDADPPMNRILTVLGACGEPAFVQLALTPAPALLESRAKRLYKRREARLSRERREHLLIRDRSIFEDAALRGDLDVQHRPLFFAELRVIAPSRQVGERIASELRVEAAENPLVERGTAIRHGLLGLYARRVQRGEGNPLPCWRRGVFAATELAAVWQFPSIDYATVPLARSALPVAPAPPGVMRPQDGRGTLCDAHGAVSIEIELRKQNTAVPGTVAQGKSSYLVASVAEDVVREACAVIVIDPKGDAADAAVSVVPPDRTCTVLDFAHPTCGFNPLAVDAPADVIADYVVGALKNLFTDADIRASSDRYLRNAIIAVLADDRRASLWDAARLLSVGEEGYAYRDSVGTRVRTLPEFKEISSFFTDELTAQLADARSTTTAKLDAPVNKLARLLNSPSIKRVLLNDSFRVDFDRVISGREVLVVKGALGAMGAGNTSVLMQLLLGMLDAALARQQDLVAASERVAVALKVDEAPLVINRGFAETMALKRSAGLETVACWQTDAQWVDREVREQLDALFAHRVYFATSSARDARAAVALTMAEFSDTVRPGVGRLSALGHPDVRLHLPRHHAIVSWTSRHGRLAPFVARTVAMPLDHERLALHAAAQHRRGGRHLSDLRQPHWNRARVGEDSTLAVASSRPRIGPGTAPATLEGGACGGPSPEPATNVELPARPAVGYRELCELDRAHSVHRVAAMSPCVRLEPDPLDLAILALIGEFPYVLSTQIHRCFNPGRSPTTTQRRLKRISDAGLVERFQLHRPDGGGVPMCYSISEHGLALLARKEGPAGDPGSAPGIRQGDSRWLAQAKHEIHVAGWALALSGAVGDTAARTRGAARSVLSAPGREVGERRVTMGPAELRLPGGRAPHDFLVTGPGGQRTAVERFDTLRPDAVIEISADGIPATDVIVERDDRPPLGAAATKLERYDHFLSGWAVQTRRYGRRAEARAVVVFVCRDRARARACARIADRVLCACRAYAGEYPFDWEYPGRAGVLFAAERDVHEGMLHAYGVPRLPPDVRVAAHNGDPREGRATVERRKILPPRS